MAVKFANNVSTTLTSAINATQTTISVADASGLPTLSSGDYVYLTIDTDTASPTIEVVKVTAISSNSLTVVRGQDGTTASSFSAGVKVELRVTAAALGDISSAADTESVSIDGDTMTGSLTIDYTGHATGDAGLLVTNDSSDWGVKIDKDGSDTYGLLVQADGTHAIMVRSSSGAQKALISGTGNADFSGAITASEQSVFTGNAISGTPNSNAQIVAADSGVAGIAIHSNDGGQGYLWFGDNTNNAVGRIYYNHSTDKVHWRVGGTNDVHTLDSSGNATFAGTITSETGTVGSSPNLLKIATATEASTAQGAAYAGLVFQVTGAENSTGAISDNTVAAIKAIDYRSGTTSFEDAGIGFYTLDSDESAHTFRGGFSNQGGFFVSVDGNVDRNTGNGDIYADSNIEAGNHLVFSNSLKLGSTVLIDNQATAYINTISITDGDFVVADGNNSPAAETNIIWRDHSADRLYLGTTTDVVEFRGDVNFQSGHILQHNGTTVLDASRNLSNIGTISSGNITSSGTITAPTLIAGAYGAGGSAGDGFRINSTDIYGQLDSTDKIHISAVTGNISGVSGHVSGKFAVKSTGVHASYDFYNNGTSYFNGQTEVNAELRISSGSAYTTHFNYQDNGQNFISQANSGGLTQFRNSNGSLMEIAASGNVTIANDLTVSGNLTVSGDTITANVGTLDVEDKNITLNYSTGDSSATANGAGITIQDAVNSTTDATILWDATNDEFDFSHPVNVSGQSTFTGSSTANNEYAAQFKNSAGSTILRARNDGRVLIPSGYLYAQHSEGIYSTGSIKARGGITNDGGNALSISSGAAHIAFNSKNFASVGDISSVGTITIPYVRVTGTGDAALSSTTHGIQVGATSGQNLLLDNNEVLSRNNGASSTLHLQADGGTVTVGAGTNANLTVNGTIQGGDFQDYNNTAYYVNPASSSVGFKTLGKIQVSQGAGGRGLEISTTSNWANASFYTPAIRFEQADGTVIAGIRGHRTAAGTTVLMLGTDWLNQTLQVTSTYGDFAGTGGVRSAIYYDRNDTAYYVDPASESKFHAINFDNTAVTPPTTTNATAGARLNLYPAGSGRDYTIGIESSNMWFNTDGGFKFYEDGNARMQVETGGHLNLSTGGLKFNGTTVIDSSRVLQNVTANASIITAGTIAEARLPTQSKYLRSDAGDTHTGGTITLGSGSSIDASTNDRYLSFRVIRNAGSANTDGMYIGYANSGGSSAPTRLFGAGATSNGLYVYDTYSLIYGSARSPIFYDSDNTAYYADPHATSRMNVIHANSYAQAQNGIVKVMFPHGGSMDIGGSPNTGAFKIALPVSWTNTMMSLKITVYDYSAHESFEIHCGGYNHTNGSLYNGSWHSCFAYIDGSPLKDRNFTVRFGHDGTKCCIQIGETTSTWSYVDVTVTEFLGGHSNDTVSNWDDGWAVTLVTSNIDIANGGQSISQTDRNRYLSIMYDVDNTGYLLDPAGTSRTSLTHADYIGIGAANNSSGSYRLNMGGHIDMNNYEVNYLNRIHFNDGTNFYGVNTTILDFQSGHGTNSQLRFKNSGGTVAGSVYGSSTSFGLLDADSNWAIKHERDSRTGFFINNAEQGFLTTAQLTHVSSVRAPVFYDSDNTAYFTSQNGTSNFNDIKAVNVPYGHPDYSAKGTENTYLNVGSNNLTHSCFFRDNNDQFGALGIHIQHPTSTGYALQIASTSYSAGSNSFQIRGKSAGTWQTVLNIIDNGSAHQTKSGIFQSNASLRAPIFYDSANTTYYADPASTSQFSGLRAGSISVGSVTTAMSSAGQIAVHSSGNPYISFHSNGGTGRSGYLQHLVDSDRFYFGEVSFTESAGSFRAPLFYDVNNTGYYVDPASSSNAAYFNGHVSLSSGNGKGYKFWNSNNYKIYMSATSSSDHGGRANGETTSDYNMYFRMTGGTNRGFTFRNNTTNVAAIDGAGNGYFNSARATIFYDVNNTGYYLDPSSANRLSNIICDRYRASGSGSNMDFEDSNGGVDMRKDPGGNLIVVGNVTAYGSTSDIRLKENIETIPNALEKVKKLDGVTFDYKKDGTRSTGLIAQQLQEVLPEVVYEATDIGEEESHLAVRYGNVVGLLVEAMKEQSAQIDALRAEIESLKGN